MTKLNTKNVETLALLLVVSLAPASIAFAQTASVKAETRADVTVDADDSDDKRKDRVKERIQDRVTDQIKKRVVRNASPIDAERGADLSFRGHADGWAIVGGKAFKSSIELGGNAHHVGGGNWKLTSEGTLAVADRHAKLDLSGHVRGNLITLQGSGALDNGEPIRVTIKGHYAPTDDRNVFAVAFTQANVHYVNSGIRVPLMQVGSVTVIDTTPTPAQQ